MKVIGNFLSKPPVQLNLWKKGIPISTGRLQTIKAGLIKDLQESCNSYVQGLIDMDEPFLKNTTSPFLFNKIQKQIQQLKADQTNVNNLQQNFAKNLDIQINYPQPGPNQKAPLNLRRYQMKIYPFVVFGPTVTQRINKHPLESVVQLTRNRYFKLNNPTEGFGTALKNIWNNQVYGFKCQIMTQQKIGKNIIITLEGDIDSQEYYVVDLNNLLFSGQLQ